MRITKDRLLEVVLPVGIPTEKGIEFVQEKRDWISRHIKFLLPEHITYRFLGKTYEMMHTHDREDQRHSVQFDDTHVHISSPFNNTTPAYDIFHMYLQRRGKLFLPERCMQLAEQTGLKPVRITIRGQKSRWGSCSRRRSISLNYKLMQFRPEMIDYVILHELCHLQEMNHSPRFWNLVKQFVPHYKKIDKELNSYQV